VTDEDQRIVLHALKDVADTERECITKMHMIFDKMCADLGITIPNRRIEDRRELNRGDNVD